MENKFLQKLMIKLSFTVLPIFVVIVAFSSCNFSNDKSASGAEIYANDTIYNFVEVSPEYPGGPARMKDFLWANLEYPERAIFQNAQGTVFVAFVVEPNGEITNTDVLRGVSEEIDQEAIRVIKKMPKWKPGLVEGEPVRVRLTIPVRFILEDFN
jgi:periplasmic protein TonB